MNQNPQEDKLSHGFGCLVTLFPPIGFALFFAWKKDYPKRAKSAGADAIWGTLIFAFVAYGAYVNGDLNGWQYIPQPTPQPAAASPYDSWTAVQPLTGKKALLNPPEVTIGAFTVQPIENPYISPKVTATVTNGFNFPVGFVLVTTQFTDSSGAIIGEATDSIGGIPANGRWQMSVSVPRGGANVKATSMTVVAP